MYSVQIDKEDLTNALTALIPGVNFSPEEIHSPIKTLAARCKLSFDSAILWVEDALDRVCIGHLNEFSNTSSFRYEGASLNLLPYLWEEGISTIPPRLFEGYDRNEYLDLCKGFRVPDKSAVYNWANDNGFDDLSEEAKRIINGNVVVVPYGTATHAVDVVFAKGYVLICNGGYCPEECYSETNIQAFKMPKIEESDYGKIQNFLAHAMDATTDPILENLKYTYVDVKDTFGEEKDSVCRQIETLSTTKQTVGNCTSFSRSIALLGALVLQRVKTGEKNTLSEEDKRFAMGLYQKFFAHVRAFPLDKYYRMREPKEKAHCFDKKLVNFSLGRTVEHLKESGVSLDYYPELKKAQNVGLTRIFSWFKK